MTVTYSLEVAEARLGGLTKLLLRWRGSIYKLIWREMLIYISLYYILNLTYRFGLNGAQKTSWLCSMFEALCKYCQRFNDLIPLSFVLGFYVSLVVGRWWNQYDAIPWPDKYVVPLGRTCTMSIFDQIHT
ncbi:hypothetical protein LAZ67_10004060 [Cordylochernes scorpioides]|uniref:Bestrophin homolog n=1 Tax=Cordylochernes scorpioides TaxID=51811 RepID=A0ABY6KXD4_9ARAC|nr:hypothetical protein LAZ67_10004060 [Cordylochernes scorpioides]